MNDNPAKFKDHCLKLLESKIKELTAQIHAVQQSANSETKSTAGDKHETAKAMAQLEVEMLSKQITELSKSIAALQRLPGNPTKSTAQAGSIVRTDIGSFYLSVSIGNIEIDGHKVMVISTQAPISKALIGKQAGDHFDWAGKIVKISGVWN